MSNRIRMLLLDTLSILLSLVDLWDVQLVCRSQPVYMCGTHPPPLCYAVSKNQRRLCIVWGWKLIKQSNENIWLDETGHLRAWHHEVVRSDQYWTACPPSCLISCADNYRVIYISVKKLWFNISQHTSMPVWYQIIQVVSAGSSLVTFLVITLT